MTSFDFKRMQVQGRLALDGASYPARKLMMIHSGVSVALGLLLSVLGYWLDMGIAQTSGLGGIGARTILETAQSLLQGASLFLLPFWSIGYIRVILHWVRREDADVSTLLSGFRCLGPVLRLMTLQGAVYLFLAVVGAYAGASIFFMTPGAQALYTVLAELTEAGITDPAALMENEVYMAASMAMAPYMFAGGALLIAPVAYRLRFAEFALMDQPGRGALLALVTSWRMTRRNCWQLLKLDLHFWWFYLAQVLIAVLDYGDVLLSGVDMELGVSADVAMFAFYIAALVCEFALFVWKKNEVFAVYALAYDQLIAPQEEPPKPQPKRVPWETAN